ncbi:MAG: hypothetical protein OES20_09735 [Gammaproteobacteria bacterium]|nr:hypothetical protein [Gammaproteobacteria bacterium]MDH3858894.1 hypothetical protein [Gammaproteobacteria bacterium]
MAVDLQSKLTICILALALILVQGCASSRPPVELPPMVETQRIQDLSNAILNLGDSIDPSEAQRAALISIEYSHELARQYEISTSPVMHNFLVNLGIKQRGLCIDWTTDLLTRLKQERFYSLDLHWAIANYETAFRLEHSTVIVSARGESIYRGLVLDSWRHSGQLYWAPTLADIGYAWKPQAEIHALKRELRANQRSVQ